MLDKAGRAALSLNTKYLRVGQSAQNRLFGVPPSFRGPSLNSDHNVTTLKMLVSHRGRISTRRLAVIIFGLCTLVFGIILSSIPWLDYLILKNLKLWNGTLSYYYWQKPGVIRLTRVFVFNVTNPEGFLNYGQKPKLEEVGPFVYRENMEKVNVKFHDNGTVSFQHKKILHFVPEMSLPLSTKVTVPNIPLLTLTSMSAELPTLMRVALSLGLKTLYRMSVFNTVNVNELLFGFDETLTNLASKFYPKGRRPPPKLGLFLGRNSTLLNDVATIHTGYTGMENFGLMSRLNGLDRLPYWNAPPCNSIRASEGSLFPPRDVTHSDVITVWDKDLCRIWPMRYKGDTVKDGVKVGLYTADIEDFRSGNEYSANKCFCPGRKTCAPDGFQDISPCQFDAPVYTSFPHFLGVEDPKILNAVEGLKPDKEKHTSFIKLQPKLGVPLEAQIKAQLNLRVTQANDTLAKNFRNIMFPIIWVQEGAEEVPANIFRLIYLSTTVADILEPIINYGSIVFGAALLSAAFLSAYKNVVFMQAAIEQSKRKIRRGSSILVNGQHRLLILRDSYSLLHNTTAETSFNPEPEN